MKGSAEIVKGRIEEAAGALTNSNKLRTKGLRDQAVGQVTKAGEKDIRQAKAVARKIVDNAKNIAKNAIADVKCRY